MSQSINNQSGSGFASQFALNKIFNSDNQGAGSTTQKIVKNQRGAQHQVVTNTSNTSVAQSGTNDATNSQKL